MKSISQNGLPSISAPDRSDTLENPSETRIRRYSASVSQYQSDPSAFNALKRDSLSRNAACVACCRPNNASNTNALPANNPINNAAPACISRIAVALTARAVNPMAQIPRMIASRKLRGTAEILEMIDPAAGVSLLSPATLECDEFFTFFM